MRIVFDLDNTLCVGTPYEAATPLPGAAEMLSQLRRQGHTIIIYTARGMGRSNGNSALAVAKVGGLTLTQLQEWGFEYDEIIFGKPAADLYVDDKAITAGSLERIQNTIQAIHRTKEVCDEWDRKSQTLINKADQISQGCGHE